MTIKTNVVLYLSEDILYTCWIKEEQTVILKNSIKNGEINQIAKQVANQFVEKNGGINIQYILCPGGIFKPLRRGIYYIDKDVVNEAQEQNWGIHNYNELTLICSELASLLSATAIMCDPMSTDELFMLNKITSHAEVKKYSRYYNCEHQAAIYNIAKELKIQPENMNVIVARIDNEVSVGAHQYGRCVDVNDVIGLEGPMGFNCSGDIPVAQLAMYTEKIGIDDLKVQLRYESGLKGYIGTDQPEKVDELVLGGDLTAILAAEAIAYQTAKWIGSSAMCLSGNVDAIVLIGKGNRCKYISNKIIERVQKIAPVYILEPNIIEYLLYVANNIGSMSSQILNYGEMEL